ncbi:hypothetical protein CHARACLAT_004824 [Characodon lateralis]|uniref:Uncharacterized protein n=1 Tax=Characodon lateralis TaxID=208331 RepID=A0ABU7DE30_9TELE|nr:hypothetical protein [Characodon lateralis]
MKICSLDPVPVHLLDSLIWSSSFKIINWFSVLAGDGQLLLQEPSLVEPCSPSTAPASRDSGETDLYDQTRTCSRLPGLNLFSPEDPTHSSLGESIHQTYLPLSKSLPCFSSGRTSTFICVTSEPL